MHRMKCGEIWGGIRGEDLDVETSSIRASLFSSSAKGEVGGDVYFFTVCDNDLLTRVIVADVAGHGETVARTAASIYDSIQEAMNDSDGAEVLGRVNRFASQYGIRAITTAAVAAFYRTTGELMFSYAGHHPLLVRGPLEEEWRALEVSDRDGPVNIPLGVLEFAQYDQATISIAAGGIVVIYTDGLVEARDNAGRPYGIDRLMGVLQTVTNNDPVEVKKKVLADLTSHAPDGLRQDDVTLIAFQVGSVAV